MEGAYSAKTPRCCHVRPSAPSFTVVVLRVRMGVLWGSPHQEAASPLTDPQEFLSRNPCQVLLAAHPREVTPSTSQSAQMWLAVRKGTNFMNDSGSMGSGLEGCSGPVSGALEFGSSENMETREASYSGPETREEGRKGPPPLRITFSLGCPVTHAQASPLSLLDLRPGQVTAQAPVPLAAWPDSVALGTPVPRS